MNNKAMITGTFIDEITYDIPSSNWSADEWKKDLDNMKVFGIDTLIFIRGGFYGKTIYPSKHFGTESTPDFLGFILDEAEKREMKVFIGLYITDIDWNHGNYKGELIKNRYFVNEIMERYGNKKSFYGWYLPHETCDNRLHIAELMAGLGAMCKDAAPDKKVLISPFFRSSIIRPKLYYSPKKHYKVWDKIFAKCGKYVDFCARQDGTAPLELMEEYYAADKALCDKYGIEMWVNAESFERDVRQMFYPIPFETLKTRLEKHAKYAEKIITFEFSHFLSPQSIYPSAKNLNARYLEYFKNGEE